MYLYGSLQDALNDLYLVAKSSVLDECPGNTHMTLVGVNAVQLPSWG